MSTWRKWFRKRLVVDHLGGKCSRCGWVGHIGCYHIHHLQPELKVSHRNRSTRFSSGVKSAGILTHDEMRELDTCELLCANCHALEAVGTTNPYLRIVDAHEARIADWTTVASKEVD